MSDWLSALSVGPFVVAETVFAHPGFRGLRLPDGNRRRAWVRKSIRMRRAWIVKAFGWPNRGFGSTFVTRTASERAITRTARSS